jgi:TetR/AcrR family transcriptional repressor of bet genes
MNGVAKMPKLGMQPIRRRQLIDATLDAINEVGMHDATIAQIARRAGVSTGIISHYFKDKNGLLEATMRDITSQLRDAVLNRLHAAGRQRQPAPAGDCRRQL